MAWRGARWKATRPRRSQPSPGLTSARAGGPARPVAELVPQIGRAAFRRFGFVQSSVVTRWPEIVGERHAQVCMPEAIRFPPGEKSGGILQLVVLPAHAPLIQHVIPEIIERVNRFFGYKAVAKAKMRQGEVKPRSTAWIVLRGSRQGTQGAAALAQADPGARTRRQLARYRRPRAARGARIARPQPRRERGTRAGMKLRTLVKAAALACVALFASAQTNHN
jgi:hypothetical protein